MRRTVLLIFCLGLLLSACNEAVMRKIIFSPGTLTETAADGSRQNVEISGVMETQEAEEGVAVKLKKNTYTAQGYRFLGWSEIVGVNNVSYLDEDTVTLMYTDLNLYAVWEKTVPVLSEDSFHFTEESVTDNRIIFSVAVSSEENVDDYVFEAVSQPACELTVEGNRITASGLQPSTEYLFTVTVHSESTEIEGSGTCRITTAAEPERSISVTDETVTFNSIVFTAVYDQAEEGKTYEWEVVSDDEEIFPTVTGGTVEVSGLAADTEYTFTVTVKESGTENILATVVHSASTSGAPELILTEKEVTKESLSFTASLNPESAISNLEVQALNGGVPTVSGNTVTVTGLSDGTLYSFAVTASYPGGSVSKEIQIETQANIPREIVRNGQTLTLVKGIDFDDPQQNELIKKTQALKTEDGNVPFNPQFNSEEGTLTFSTTTSKSANNIQYNVTNGADLSEIIYAEIRFHVTAQHGPGIGLGTSPADDGWRTQFLYTDFTSVQFRNFGGSGDLFYPETDIANKWMTAGILFTKTGNEKRFFQNGNPSSGKLSTGGVSLYNPQEFYLYLGQDAATANTVTIDYIAFYR